MDSNLIWTPEHPDFDTYLCQPPPGWQENHLEDGQGYMVVDKYGMPRMASHREFVEYSEGGEYEEVVSLQPEEDDDYLEYYL